MLSMFACLALYKVYLFHTDPAAAHIKKGRLSDFWISILAAFVIGFLRKLLRVFLLDSIIPYLSENRLRTMEEGRRRAD